MEGKKRESLVDEPFGRRAAGKSQLERWFTVSLCLGQCSASGLNFQVTEVGDRKILEAGFRGLLFVGRGTSTHASHSCSAFASFGL